MKNLLKNLFSSLLLTAILLGSLVLPSSVFASSSYYTNISGSKIHVPVQAQVIPIGATARCRDGSYSYSQHKRGTCSYHGGVRSWLY